MPIMTKDALAAATGMPQDVMPGSKEDSQLSNKSEASAGTGDARKRSGRRGAGSAKERAGSGPPKPGTRAAADSAAAGGASVDSQQLFPPEPTSPPTPDHELSAFAKELAAPVRPLEQSAASQAKPALGSEAGQRGRSAVGSASSAGESQPLVPADDDDGVIVATAPDEPAASADDTALAVPAKKQRMILISGSTGYCWFECGTTHNLQNIANERSPKLVCALCNSSRRALEGQAKISEVLRDWLRTVKKTRSSEYKAEVRVRRLVPGGLETIEQRREELARFAAYHEVQASVKESTPVMWLTCVQYMAFESFWNGKTRSDAEAEFRQAVANPDIEKRGTREEPKVPCEGISTTVGSVERSYRHSIGSSSRVASDEQLRIACQRMNPASLKSPASGYFNDVGGGMFLPGKSLGSASGSANAMTCALSNSAALTGTSMDNLRAISLAPRNEQDAGSMQRQLARQASVPSESGEAERKMALRMLEESMSCEISLHCCYIRKHLHMLST